MAQGGEKSRFGYRAVADHAWEELSTRPEDFMRRGGALQAGTGLWRMPFFGRECTIHTGERAIRDNGGKKFGVTVEIVILHYLLRAQEVPLSGRPKSFREFEGAEAYQDAFRRRVVEPLARAFGGCPDKFASAAMSLGGTPASLRTGDHKFTVPTVPRIPVTCILWLGDDEVPPSAQVLFDDTADQQVLVEDLAVVGEFVAYLLVREAGLELSDVGGIFSYG